MTAGLYAKRAALKAALFEKAVPGGQVAITKGVENYPGFEHGIQGTELIMKPTMQTQDAVFKQQVTNYLRQYGKVVAWIRKDNFVAIRLNLHDPKGQLQKQLFVRRLGREGGRTVIKESRMVNKREGTSTLLRLDSTRALPGRPDDIFTVRNLARGL